MVLRIVGCGGRSKDAREPRRACARALDYATRMGAKILSFSAHWARRSAGARCGLRARSRTGPETPTRGDRRGQRAEQGRSRGGISGRLSLPAHRARRADRQRQHNLARHQRCTAGAQLRRAERLRARRHGGTMRLPHRAWELEFDRDPIRASRRYLVQPTLC